MLLFLLLLVVIVRVRCSSALLVFLFNGIVLVMWSRSCCCPYSLLVVLVRVRCSSALLVFLFGGIVLVMWSRSWYRSYSLPVAINIIPVIVNGLTLVLVRCACDLFVFVVRLPVLCYASLFVNFGGVRCSCSWR